MATCPECGAPVPAGGSCRDNFHALLALEWEVPDGAGTLAHFFAVSSYGLQHPDSMGYTVDAIDWLRSAVTEALATGCSVELLRASARAASARAASAGTHVTRREGDQVPGWGVGRWSITVEDVVAGGADDYLSRVTEWARAIVSDIGTAEAGGTADRR